MGQRQREPAVDDTDGGSMGSGPDVLRVTRDRLVRLAYRFLWNLDDAEEVAQDALAAAWEKAAELRDGKKWWAWVCRIVVHRCHELGRRQQRHERHALRLFRWARPVGHEDGASGIDEQDAQRHLAERVRQKLAFLPERQREAVVLRHLEGWSYDRIANTLGISESTARVHARAGRESLRDMLLAEDANALRGTSEAG